jgi:hypothetical protein
MPYLGIQDHEGILALDPRWIPHALLAATGLGLLKGFTVLSNAAQKTILRLEHAGHHAPLSSLFNGRTGLLIGFMVGLGIGVRELPYPSEAKAWLISILYPGIALALCIGSLRLLNYRSDAKKDTEECKQMPWQQTQQET